MLVNRIPLSSSKKKRGRGSGNRGVARLVTEDIPGSALGNEWEGVLNFKYSAPLGVTPVQEGPGYRTPLTVPPPRRRRGRGKKRSAKSAPRTYGVSSANMGELRKCVDPWDVKERIVDGIQRKCRRVSCGWIETLLPDAVEVANNNQQNAQGTECQSADDPVFYAVKASDTFETTGDGDVRQCQLTPASHEDSGRRVSTRLRNRLQLTQLPESTATSCTVSLAGTNGSQTPMKTEDKVSGPCHDAKPDNSSEAGYCEKRASWSIHNSYVDPHRDQSDLNPLRMKLRKRSHSSGEALETGVKSVSNGGSERTSKRMFGKEEWRKTAEGVLKKVQLCQQWIKIAKLSQRKMGLSAVQNCLPDCSKPEEVISRVLEVSWDNNCNKC